MHNQETYLIQKLTEENLILTKKLSSLQQNYEDLRSKELETAFLLEEMPLGEINLDENANFIACNSKFAELLGYSKEDLLGKNFDYILAEGHEFHKASFDNFKKVGADSSMTWKMLKKDGEIVTTVLYARPKFSNKGTFISGRGYIVDITDKMNILDALKKSEKEKVLILQSMSESIAYYGKDMNVIWANNNVAGIFNKELGDIIGKDCKQFCSKDKDYCSLCPMMNAKTKLVCQSDEIHINDNTQILMTVQPIINDAGEFAGLVQMISDITERKTLAKKLSEASTLERRKIGQDIHDGLCQMLSGIRFMASALQCELECCGSHLAKDAEDIVDHMKTALTMLRGLIQGLCPMGIEPQDLINSLKNLSGNIETVYKIKCNFCYDDSIIFSDYETANHLFLIAHESLYNAVKHSCCDAMDVSLLKKGKNIILSVKDNGLGIPPDLGSCKGMGIKIIRNRAMEIRGILSIHSEEGSGTSITVTIDEKNLNPVEDCHEQTV